MDDNLELKSKTKTTTKPELNAFLVFLLILGIIGTITQNISECIKSSLWNDFSLVFCVIDFILASIHIAGILLILLKKNIYGYYIIIGNFLLSMILTPSINAICNYPVFDVLNMTILGISKIIIISLLLLLRKNGISAFKTLITQKNDKHRTTNLLEIDPNQNHNIK